MDLTQINKPFGELDRETKIALFTAWVDGAKIEYDGDIIYDMGWYENCVYRVAPTKPSIDWSHVAPQFKWMATDADCTTMLYEEKPIEWKTEWGWTGGDCTNITCLASFRPGTCDWKDSLVQRPEGV